LSGGPVRPKLSTPKLSWVRVRPKLSGEKFLWGGYQGSLPHPLLGAPTCHLGPSVAPPPSHINTDPITSLAQATFPREEEDLPVLLPPLRIQSGFLLTFFLAKSWAVGGGEGCSLPVLQIGPIYYSLSFVDVLSFPYLSAAAEFPAAFNHH